MEVTRRTVVAGLSATTLALGGLKLLGGSSARAQPTVDGYGPLVPDPARLLDLPRGFSYRIVSREGEPMSDGLLTPAAFDGMACFPVRGAPHRVALVRNHEMWSNLTEGGAFGPGHELAGEIPRAKIFDFASDGSPKLGGTTTLIWDLRQQRLLRSHLSLAGTCGNCAGGPTPWGSWLTCEETLDKDAPLVGRPHGWVFEVRSRATGLADPIPLTAMGRFVHEAATVDPRTGIVYLTEDRPDSLFYRFLPNVRGQLARGGRLQALGLTEQRERDLRNWPADGSRFAGQGAVLPVGGSASVRWIDLDNVESPDGDLKERGFARGALRFARGEGLALGRVGRRTEIFICCTMGGPTRLGQVWRYRPSPSEGGAEEAGDPGRLELFVEAEDAERLKNCDNVAVAPWGDLILCEDGADDQPQYLRGVTPQGQLYSLARNGYSEFAGACFAPDGSTLFVNAQSPGITFAIRGPWQRLDPRPLMS
ncbi:MAG TPA: alkaline phosphatase PhoX [Allosphingosinicella sp.]|nr:alkaline phosphatase PhoX [Allosphingosinicella sp.]